MRTYQLSLKPLEAGPCDRESIYQLKLIQNKLLAYLALRRPSSRFQCANIALQVNTSGGSPNLNHVADSEYLLDESTQ
jgi:hypothetical protein